MQKRVGYLLPLVPLVLSTCSWMTTFAVSNRRAERIRVTYFARPLRTPPFVAASGHLSDARAKWLVNDSSLVWRDSATLTTVLGRDSMLVLAEIGTYTGYRDES